MKTKLKHGQRARAPHQRIPAKWRWHFEALLAERERLLSERLTLLRAAAAPIEPPGMDAADRATDEFDHDLALGELSAGCAMIREVDEGIHRILNGNYGICEATGRPIPALRLRAIPWARYCAKAEEQLERGGAAVRAQRAEEEAARISGGTVAVSRVRRGKVNAKR